MKKITILLLMLFAFGTFLNAATKTSTGSGDWSAAGTWSPSGVPGDNDDVTILTGHSIAFNQNDKVKYLTIQVGGELTGNYDLEVKDDLYVYGTLTIKKLKKVDNITVYVDGTLVLTDKIDDCKNIITYGSIVTKKVKGAFDNISIYLGGSFVVTETGGPESELKVKQTLYVAGNLSIVNKLKIENGTTSVVIDGTVNVAKFDNKAKIDITGTGKVIATAEYKNFSGTATLFGVPGPVVGKTYGGATWSGATDDDWNTASNWWAATVPTSAYVVVINEGAVTLPVLAGTGNAKSVIIHEGSLTIESGADLTVAEDIENTVGNAGLVIQSTSSGTGSLIYTSGTPSATVERYCAASQWHFVSPSTSGVTAQNFYDSGNAAWLAWFDEAAGLDGGSAGEGWYYFTELTDPIDVGTGYSYAPSADETVNFTGTIASSDFVAGISFTDARHGYNLIGNPFSSAVEWNTNSDWNLSGMQATIWIWVPTTGTSGNYVSYTTAATYDIPVGQGFFVQANAASPTLTIPASQRLHSSNTFYKNSNDESGYESFVTIQADNNQNRDKVQISFAENGTDDFDNGWDGTKMFGSDDAPQLYLVEQELKQSYDHLPLLAEGEERTVIMNYIAGADGDQVLTADLTNLIDLGILIEDLQTGATQDLEQNPVYTFTGYKTDDSERFLLHFTYSPNGIGEGIAQISNINIYSSGKDIYVNSTDGTFNSEGTIYVYDLMGREIAQQAFRSGELVKLTVNMRNAYAVVKVVKEGFVKTEKVFIK